MKHKFKTLWDSYEEEKMCIKDGEPYFLIEMKWFENFCKYIGVNEEAKIETNDTDENNQIPGEITNYELLNVNEKVLCLDDPKFDGWLNRNLKDNLRENNDFIIVNQEIWNFLEELFSGYEIRRYGTLISGDDTIIEINL